MADDGVNYLVNGRENGSLVSVGYSEYAVYRGLQVYRDCRYQYNARDCIDHICNLFFVSSFLLEKKKNNTPTKVTIFFLIEL